MKVFNYDDNPVGHAVVEFKNSEVESILGEIGGGFGIAQSRLI